MYRVCVNSSLHSNFISSVFSIRAWAVAPEAGISPMFSRRRPLRLAAVEGGGTTFVVGIADGTAANIVERAEFPTTTPEETLGRCAEWLAARDYDALGVACFGPLDLRKESRMYGHITTTPKPGWQFADVLGPLCRVRPNVPVALDTDVNAPALAEYRHAAAAALVAGQPKPTSSAYVTVGTGIGVGLVVNCEPVHGLMHPEGGHVSVPRLASDSGFPGSNPKDTFNGNCIENLTCSHSLAKRAGLSDPSELRALPDDHPVWAAAAHYLGVLCANITLMVSPEKIVLSGGIMQRDSLWPNVRREAQAALK